MLTKEDRQELIKEHGKSQNDSGTAEVQIALFTKRILDLTQHINRNKKDFHSRRGLINLVSKRRKMLDYLAKNDINRYRDILSKLSLRK